MSLSKRDRRVSDGVAKDGGGAARRSVRGRRRRRRKCRKHRRVGPPDDLGATSTPVVTGSLLLSVPSPNVERSKSCGARFSSRFRVVSSNKKKKKNIAAGGKNHPRLLRAKRFPKSRCVGARKTSRVNKTSFFGRHVLGRTFCTGSPRRSATPFVLKNKNLRVTTDKVRISIVGRRHFFPKSEASKYYFAIFRT